MILVQVTGSLSDRQNWVPWSFNLQAYLYYFFNKRQSGTAILSVHRSTKMIDRSFIKLVCWKTQYSSTEPVNPPKCGSREKIIRHFWTIFNFM